MNNDVIKLPRTGFGMSAAKAAVLEAGKENLFQRTRECNTLVEIEMKFGRKWLVRFLESLHVFRSPVIAHGFDLSEDQPVIIPRELVKDRTVLQFSRNAQKAYRNLYALKSNAKKATAKGSRLCLIAINKELKVLEPRWKNSGFSSLKKPGTYLNKKFLNEIFKDTLSTVNDLEDHINSKEFTTNDFKYRKEQSRFGKIKKSCISRIGEKDIFNDDAFAKILSWRCGLEEDLVEKDFQYFEKRDIESRRKLLKSRKKSAP